jgi:hypothetical protein
VEIVIDDGGHGMRQQIHTFEEMFPALRVGGVFPVEDLHTNHWEEYGGGYRRERTMIEYGKDLIDQLNAWHSRDTQLAVGDYTRTVSGMHVYDSVIVFDKADLPEPHHEQMGSGRSDPVVYGGGGHIATPQGTPGFGFSTHLGAAKPTWLFLDRSS